MCTSLSHDEMGEESEVLFYFSIFLRPFEDEKVVKLESERADCARARINSFDINNFVLVNII